MQKYILLAFSLFLMKALNAQEDKYYEKGFNLSYLVHSGQDIIQENDSTFVISGNTINTGEGWNGHLLKVNVRGDTLSSVIYTGLPPHNDFKIFDMVRTGWGYAMCYS